MNAKSIDKILSSILSEALEDPQVKAMRIATKWVAQTLHLTLAIRASQLKLAPEAKEDFDSYSKKISHTSDYLAKQYVPAKDVFCRLTTVAQLKSISHLVVETNRQMTRILSLSVEEFNSLIAEAAESADVTL
jgi:hypothetical protein